MTKHADKAIVYLFSSHCYARAHTPTAAAEERTHCLRAIVVVVEDTESEGRTANSRVAAAGMVQEVVTA